MYSEILVPLDGSEIAECVLPYVEVIATSAKPVTITFLYVVQPFDVPIADQKYKAKIESEAQAAANNYLLALTNKLNYKDRVHNKVVLGHAADSIADYATSNNIKLIIMATHGRSGINRWVQGSIADKIIHVAKVPIWLIKPETAKRALLKNDNCIKILVPLDGSELAEVALKHVRELTTNQFGTKSAEITLIRVLELFFPPYSYPPPTPMTWQEYLTWEKKRCTEICETYLLKIQKELSKEGIPAQGVVPDGNPADAIIDYANKNGINLIVMSTHGRTGLGRWALGSIADKVLKSADCSIFLVRNR